MSTDCKGYNKFCFRLEILFLPMCVWGGVHVGGGTHRGQKGGIGSHGASVIHGCKAIWCGCWELS